jgi:pSer/pThr/pTyr-binding forkhead associated (FHA) protein
MSEEGKALRASQRVQEQDEGKILKVRLSLKGRPIKSYVFSKVPVVVGRSPDCDVFLDNPGVSREHLRIERTPDGGFEAIDLGSANGSLLNSRPLKRAYITQDDVIQIGKFTLWIAIDTDRRADTGGPHRMSVSKEEGTTVLSTEELERMVTSSREKFQYEDVEPRRENDDDEEWGEARTGPSRVIISLVIVGTLVLGLTIGAICMRMLMH